MKNRFTKSELNTCITWSSSKYNQYKKSEVIESILKLQDSDEDGERIYSCGSWTEPTQKSRYSKMKSMNCQGSYVFKNYVGKREVSCWDMQYFAYWIEPVFK